MRRALWLVALVVGCSAAWAVSAQDIGWQEAVARLAQERTLAETCAGAAEEIWRQPARSIAASWPMPRPRPSMTPSSPASMSRWRASDQPASLPDLEARLQRGFDKREAFCDSVATASATAAAGAERPHRGHRRRRDRAADRRGQGDLAAHPRRRRPDAQDDRNPVGGNDMAVLRRLSRRPPDPAPWRGRRAARRTRQPTRAPGLYRPAGAGRRSRHAHGDRSGVRRPTGTGAGR